MENNLFKMISDIVSKSGDVVFNIFLLFKGFDFLTFIIGAVLSFFVFKFLYKIAIEFINKINDDGEDKNG